MVADSTAPPCSSNQWGRSVPPPTKLNRSGAASSSEIGKKTSGSVPEQAARCCHRSGGLGLAGSASTSTSGNRSILTFVAPPLRGRGQAEADSYQSARREGKGSKAPIAPSPDRGTRNDSNG